MGDGNARSGCLFPIDGRHSGVRDARRVRVSRNGHGAPQEPGQRARQNPRRFRHLDRRLFPDRLHDRLRRRLLPECDGDCRRRRRLRGAGLYARPLLLPLHLRRRGTGDHLRRHRRARQVRAASRGDGGARRPVLSAARRRLLERQLRAAGELLQRAARRAVQGFRRLHRRACFRRMGGARRRAHARTAPRPLRGARHGIGALVDSVACHGLVAAVHRLVRVQRDERAAPRSGVGPRRHQLADGHERRHHRGDDRRR